MTISPSHPAPHPRAATKIARASIAALLLFLAMPLAAQPLSDIEATDLGVNQMQGVGIDEKNGAQLPLDLAFTDESGRSVTLADYIRGDKPVILNLVYYTCPSMCTIQLSELVKALRELAWTPGGEFRIVTVSINPDEQPGMAALKKQTLLSVLERPQAADGWHLLTGSKDSIAALADSVGFRFRYIPESGQYAHDASLILLTPQGVVSRYLRGTSYQPDTLRLALVEASQGTVGTALDRFWVSVCGYDAAYGAYVLQARRLLAIGGVVTMFALGGLILWFIRKGRRNDPSSPHASPDRPERLAHA